MPAKHHPGLWIPLVVVVVLVGGLLALGFLRRASRFTGMAFHGTSDKLKQTIVVPTLDTPMPEGKNVIWCAPFQLAWNEMRDEVVGEPVRLANAEQLAERLNTATISADDLDMPYLSYYAKAGAISDGVVGEIRERMIASFPDEPRPRIKASENAVVVFGYLATGSGISLAFFETEKPLLFDTTPALAFGIRESEKSTHEKLREQVTILYLLPKEADTYSSYQDRGHTNDFAIDPCPSSSPFQIILACVEPKATLAETIAHLDRKIADWNGEDQEREFGIADVLLMPTMAWFIEHHFAELEGQDKTILNEGCPVAGCWFGEASTMIDFRLDRSGARFFPEAQSELKATGRWFVFDRPFLIVMRKRGSTQPFFVMWVDNAELLCKP